MAHKSIIVCDHCGMNEPVGGSPYPVGWGAVSMTTYTRPDGKALSTEKKDRDLCPTCFGKVRVVVG